MANTIPTDLTYNSASFALIDGSGDKRSVSLRLDTDTTEAQARAVANALGAATQANLYEFTFSRHYAASPNAALAGDAERDSVYDNVVILFKDAPTGQAINMFIPAPLPAVMDGESDRVDTGNALYLAVRNTTDTALGRDFAPLTTRYTERREINDTRAPA